MGSVKPFRPYPGRDHVYPMTFQVHPDEIRAIRRVAALDACLRRESRPRGAWATIMDAVQLYAERLDRDRVRARTPEPDSLYGWVDRECARRFPYYFGDGSPHNDLGCGVPYDPTTYQEQRERDRVSREARLAARAARKLSSAD